MRLAVFTNQFPGKTCTFFARDMIALQKQGIDVEIFAFYPPDPALWRYVPDVFTEHDFPRTKIHHIKLLTSLCSLRPWPLNEFGRFVRDAAAISASALRFGVGPLAKSMYVFPKAWAWSQLEVNRYNHILAYWGNYAASTAYLVHRRLNRSIPFSIFLHAGMDLYWNPVYLKRKLLYADNIIVVCDFNRRYLEEHYGDIFPRISKKIHKYHLGLDFPEFSYNGELRTARRVLAVGSLEKYKGYDYLLRAAGQLRGRSVQFEIEIIGHGSQADSLRRLVDELGITDIVRFKGQLPFDQVRAAMSKASVLVHPSSGLGDAVPTVIKEAMATGLPVIASDVAGIPELLDDGNCGVLVPQRNVEALSMAIGRLLADDKLRLKYAGAGREFAESTFDLWKNSQELADLLKQTTRSQ
jgi:colanic acid/amylovoran biosynthesis glycosyltransferase